MLYDKYIVRNRVDSSEISMIEFRNKWCSSHHYRSLLILFYFFILLKYPKRKEQIYITCPFILIVSLEFIKITSWSKVLDLDGV